jgi:hypothetical protein
MQIKGKTEAKLQEGSSQRIQSRVNLHFARYNWTTKKIKEQQNMMDEQSSAVTEFLKI